MCKKNKKKKTEKNVLQSEVNTIMKQRKDAHVLWGLHGLDEHPATTCSLQSLVTITGSALIPW